LALRRCRWALGQTKLIYKDFPIQSGGCPQPCPCLGREQDRAQKKKPPSEPGGSHAFTGNPCGPCPRQSGIAFRRRHPPDPPAPIGMSPPAVPPRAGSQKWPRRLMLAGQVRLHAWQQAEKRRG
jgi:hypothetical protein